MVSLPRLHPAITPRRTMLLDSVPHDVKYTVSDGTFICLAKISLAHSRAFDADTPSAYCDEGFPHVNSAALHMASNASLRMGVVALLSRYTRFRCDGPLGYDPLRRGASVIFI